MIDIEIVQQRSDWDCVIACLAMWTGRSYEEVLAVASELDPKLRFEGRGVDGVLKQDIMKRFNMYSAVMMSAYSCLRGILSFPSLNVPGGAHAVYYDGRYIHDPQTDRPNRKWYPKESSGLWPSCYTFTIDLNDPYSRQMYELEINTSKNHLAKAKGQT